MSFASRTVQVLFAQFRVLFVSVCPPVRVATLALAIPLSRMTVPVVPLYEARSVLTAVLGPVTFPDPAGDAQVPSPRQKVEADAEIPPLRLPTGRLPVTSFESRRCRCCSRSL